MRRQKKTDGNKREQTNKVTRTFGLGLRIQNVGLELSDSIYQTLTLGLALGLERLVAFGLLNSELLNSDFFRFRTLGLRLSISHPRARTLELEISNSKARNFSFRVEFSDSKSRTRIMSFRLADSHSQTFEFGISDSNSRTRALGLKLSDSESPTRTCRLNLSFWIGLRTRTLQLEFSDLKFRLGLLNSDSHSAETQKQRGQQHREAEKKRRRDMKK